MTVLTARQVPEAAKTFDDTASDDFGLADLEAIYREHHDFVWRNARRLGCHPSLLDDVVHEVFLVVARRLGEFRGQAQVRSWLFAITYHVLQRLRRDHARYQKRLDEYGIYRASLPNAPQESADAGHELRRLLLALSEPKRLVFVMSELEGMTTHEIAECLQMKPGTVDSRLRAARIDLQSMLAREDARVRRFLP